MLGKDWPLLSTNLDETWKPNGADGCGDAREHGAVRDQGRLCGGPDASSGHSAGIHFSRHFCDAQCLPPKSRWRISFRRMPSQGIVPIVDLFEAHLPVTNLDRAVAFYKDHLGLTLARVFPERKAAFFWIGAPQKAMLGLWEGETITMPIRRALHTAFHVTLSDLQDAPARLRKAGIEPKDLDGFATDEPVVLAWMPAASIYFEDPDHNLLEFITILPDTPRPELGVLSWKGWIHRKPPNQDVVSVKRFHGSRLELRSLFEQADDSQAAIDSYIELGEVFVARREQCIVGHLQLITNGLDGEIKSLSVIENQRHKGIGASLVRAGLDHAFSTTVPRVVVATASADISNLRFYQRLGFRMERIERNVFSIDRGYPNLQVDGIPVRDRVWLSISSAEYRERTSA